MTIVPETPTQLLFYEGPGYYLSNFSSFAIKNKSILWMTVEHAYQAEKFSSEQEPIRRKIRNAMSAHEAKQIAREHRSEARPDWNEVKLDVMEMLLRIKFAQHAYVRRKLLQTGTILLVEDSPKDSFWGRGPDWKDRNELGKLWMKIRAQKLEEENRDNRRGKKL